MGTLLNPDSVAIWRRVAGAVGPTGNAVTTPTKIYDEVGALVDPAARADLQFKSVSGAMVAQTDLGFIDGIRPMKFLGVSPGGSVTVDGFSYIVAADGLAAFLDVQPFDVLVKGTTRYLVLQVAPYTGPMPSLQLHLNFGEAWT